VRRDAVRANGSIQMACWQDMLYSSPSNPFVGL